MLISKLKHHDLISSVITESVRNLAIISEDHISNLLTNGEHKQCAVMARFYVTQLNLVVKYFANLMSNDDVLGPFFRILGLCR